MIKKTLNRGYKQIIVGFNEKFIDFKNYFISLKY